MATSGIFKIIYDDSKQEALESLGYRWRELTGNPAKAGDIKKYAEFYDTYKSSWRQFDTTKLLKLFREYDDKYDNIIKEKI